MEDEMGECTYCCRQGCVLTTAAHRGDEAYKRNDFPSAPL